MMLYLILLTLVSLLFLLLCNPSPGSWLALLFKHCCFPYTGEFVFLTYRLPNPFISIFVILPSQSSTSFVFYVFPSACQTQLSARVSLCIYFLLQLTGGDFFLLSLLRNSYCCKFSLRFRYSLHRSISLSCPAAFFSHWDLLLVPISPCSLPLHINMV